MTQSEIELVEKAKQGDRIALAEIVAQNEKMVYNTALRLVANTEEAECVLQETFLKVFQVLRDFKGHSSLSTWIYRIATNFALMRLRDKKKEFAGLENVESKVSKNAIGAFNRAIGNNPHRAVVNNELRNRMEQAISELPPKFRSVFVLKDVEGFSLKEISDMLDMSLAAVKSNLHRARLYLRDQLAEFSERRNG
ncbi:sigma-70 family RNA polymerase sigma factor [candidate division KSB1 bacterium]|nr:sigma-70 family RNA polymerase sigma factor [candidate division KSB1 bacterium]